MSTYFAAELLPLLGGAPRLRMLHLGADELYRFLDPAVGELCTAKRGAVVAALLALYAVGGYTGGTSLRWGSVEWEEAQEAGRQRTGGRPAPAPLQRMLSQLQRLLEDAGCDPGRVQVVPGSRGGLVAV